MPHGSREAARFSGKTGPLSGEMAGTRGSSAVPSPRRREEKAPNGERRFFIFPRPKLLRCSSSDLISGTGDDNDDGGLEGVPVGGCPGRGTTEELWIMWWLRIVARRIGWGGKADRELADPVSRRRRSGGAGGTRRRQTALPEGLSRRQGPSRAR